MPSTESPGRGGTFRRWRQEDEIFNQGHLLHNEVRGQAGPETPILQTNKTSTVSHAVACRVAHTLQ